MQDLLANMEADTINNEDREFSELFQHWSTISKRPRRGAARFRESTAGPAQRRGVEPAAGEPAVNRLPAVVIRVFKSSALHYCIMANSAVYQCYIRVPRY